MELPFTGYVSRKIGVSRFVALSPPVAAGFRKTHLDRDAAWVSDLTNVGGRPLAIFSIILHVVAKQGGVLSNEDAGSEIVRQHINARPSHTHRIDTFG